MKSIKEQVVEEIHKPARKNYVRRRVIIRGLDDLIQADLVEMIPYAKFNKGFRYILVVINVFSKYVWALPVKRKTGKEVTAAMQTILKKMKKIPKNIQTDNGKEFYNKDFNSLMETYKLNHYSTYSNLKASIVERVNRTLKSLMWKQFSLQGNYKWLNLLQHLVDKYNNTVHSTIHMKPKDINIKNSKSVIIKFRKNTTLNKDTVKFKVNDPVRISKYREQFSKGYTPNWSNEIFKIRKVQHTTPTTYLLQDQNLEDILGSFYSEELKKTSYPDVYLVEKILRRKGNRVLVKWLGLDSRFNSWINKKDVVS